MSNPNPALRYRIEKLYRQAESGAFDFVNWMKRHIPLSETGKNRLEDVGGKTSPFWIFMSFAGLVAAFGLGIFGAYNAQGAIAAFVDPTAEGTFPQEVLLMIGASLTIVGMLLGHLIYEGIAEGFKTDPYTGEREVSSKIGMSAVGLIGGLFYVGMQFYLVKSAGDGAQEGNSGLAVMPYVVAGVAIIELAIGGIFLHKAFAYMLLFATSLMLWMTVRQMNASAITTNKAYRDYLVLLDAYNNENPASRMEKEGNENIRKAIAYYSGIKLPQDEGTPSGNGATEQQQAATEGAPQQKSNAENNQQETGNNGKTQEKQFEDFINDTTDEDLTA